MVNARKPEHALPPAVPVTAERLLALLQSTSRVLLIAGQPIDGDSLASAVACHLILNKLGITSDIACGSRVPENLRFLTANIAVLTQPDFLRYQAILVFDCGELKQTGYLEQLLTIIQNHALAQVVNIDHHLQDPIYGHHCVIDQNAAATGVLLYRMLKLWQQIEPACKELLDPATAEAILTTLYNDTGSFQHSNTSAESLRIAADCVRHGADAAALARTLYRNKSRKVLRLWGRALERLKVQPGSRMAVSFVTQQDLRELRVEPEEAKGIVSILSYVPESKFALLLSEELPNVVKGSLRSDEGKGTDVSRIARLLGGGGHKLASGFKLEGRLEQHGDSFRVV
ncbi:MAG: DHH family phosphoesterase [Parcubacteria group bacterium]